MARRSVRWLPIGSRAVRWRSVLGAWWCSVRGSVGAARCLRDLLRSDGQHSAGRGDVSFGERCAEGAVQYCVYGALRCSTVRCGCGALRVRCAAVQYGALRCTPGAVQYCALRCGAVRCAAVRSGCGAVLCGAVRCGALRCAPGAVQYCALRCGAVRCGAVRVRCSTVRCGAVRGAAVRSGCGALRCNALRWVSARCPEAWVRSTRVAPANRRQRMALVCRAGSALLIMRRNVWNLAGESRWDASIAMTDRGSRRPQAQWRWP